jgi:CBS domain-containing protein
MDTQGNLMGAITYAHLCVLMDQPAMLDRPLGELAECAVQTIFGNEPLRAAVQRMAETGATRLLVVNPADARKLVGKVALHDVLTARSRHLQDERRRQRILPWEYLVPRGLRATR